MSNVDLSVAPLTDEEIQERIQALNDYDERIIHLLETASKATKALENGKHHSNSPELASADRQQFQEQAKEYYKTLEHVSIGLRKEIRTLHQQSKEKVLPVSLAAKAQWVGKKKEHEVWHHVDELLEAAGSSKQSKQDQVKDEEMKEE